MGCARVGLGGPAIGPPVRRMPRSQVWGGPNHAARHARGRVSRFTLFDFFCLPSRRACTKLPPCAHGLMKARLYFLAKKLQCRHDLAVRNKAAAIEFRQ